MSMQREQRSYVGSPKLSFKVRYLCTRYIGSDKLMSKEAESRGRLWFMAGKTF
ncbi:MAG: hypothetical protein IKR28_02250 [Selenomonadaceae bacterium]|nr:hypothetical protein [Selenomonadaceae bacterium]